MLIKIALKPKVSSSSVLFCLLGMNEMYQMMTDCLIVFGQEKGVIFGKGDIF